LPRTVIRREGIRTAIEGSCVLQEEKNHILRTSDFGESMLYSLRRRRSSILAQHRREHEEKKRKEKVQHSLEEKKKEDSRMAEEKRIEIDKKTEERNRRVIEDERKRKKFLELEKVTSEKNDEVVAKVAEKEVRIEEESLLHFCVVCMEEKENMMIFFPCKHMSTCSECGENENLTKCPACFGVIKKKVIIA